MRYGESSQVSLPRVLLDAEKGYCAPAWEKVLVAITDEMNSMSHVALTRVGALGSSEASNPRFRPDLAQRRGTLRARTAGGGHPRSGCMRTTSSRSLQEAGAP